MTSALRVGIDASNLRRGGGRTHLIELLQAADPAAHGFERLVVWGSRETLALLPERDWLLRRQPPALEAGLWRRALWQRRQLSLEAEAEGCNLLLVPGGLFPGQFRPAVVMCRNMLPFEWRELLRYGCSLTTLRLLLLRRAQAQAFRRAEGVVFLSRYASEHVQAITGALAGESEIISHGLNHRFLQPPRPQRPIEAYDAANPYRILYVSIIDVYKHPWHLVAAVGRLRQRTGWPLVLELAGPAHGPSLRRLQAAVGRWDPGHDWVTLHGAVAYEALDRLYAAADLGAFASSCENMPNILLETMASGLPVVSSDRGPMPEILGDSGLYFDPEDPESIERSLHKCIADPWLRQALARDSHAVAQQHTWRRCADRTFAFLRRVALAHPRLSGRCAA